MSGETHQNDAPCDKATKPPPEACYDEKLDGSTISTITSALLATPVNQKSKIAPTEMGLPPIPPLPTLKMIDKSLIEDGYDTDCQLGPFVEAGVEAEKIVCMDKAPLESEKPNIRESENVKNLDTVNAATANPILTNELIDKMALQSSRLNLKNEEYRKMV